MMDNHVYNLMAQLTEENQSLWRIKKHYKDDAGDCEVCAGFWEKMEKDKEEHIREISGMLKEHLK